MRAPNGTPHDELLVAYFSLEFGVDERLPIYSGGLGVLAGDHLKSASDLGVPLVAVGLFYREGYFGQEIAPDGQCERYATVSPDELGLAPTEVAVEVEIGAETVAAAVWRYDVGNVPLFLLDSDVAGNGAWARRLTARLYGGDRETRLGQELLLGVGGTRALAALGLAADVFHLNEGHAALASLERARALVDEHGLPFAEALERIRRSTVFTTHTPVPAGNEVFDGALAQRLLEPLVERLGVPWETVAELGRSRAGDRTFGLTPFALRTAERRNGVSRLHGEVARRMWAHLWPQARDGGVPIGHVTNGVHAPTWVSPELAHVLESCGIELAAATQTWERARDVDLAELGRVRRLRKEELLAAVRERAGVALDPDVLTIGFARRFATYKRADLVLSNRKELAALLGDDDRPIQILFAGKAHPDDRDGKRMLAEIVKLAGSAEAHGRVAFLAGYDLALARLLVQGVDLWLNVPRRGEEASGTSGMKAALNGTPSLSVLDGWWDEGYAPEAGWAIAGAGAGDPVAQDAADAAELFRLLRDDVRDAYDDPARWLALGRAAIERAGTRFTSARMVAEYNERFYLPAHRDAAADNLTPPSRAPR